MSDDALDFAITDYTQSEYAGRFVALYGDQLRYIPDEDIWLYYTDGRWEHDSYEYAKYLCDKMCRQILDDTPAGESGKPGWRAAARERCSHASVVSICKLARTRRPIVTKRNKFDRDPYLLNMPNGTYDLRTGELGPHDPRHMITKMTAASYDPRAKGPSFVAYFKQVQPEAHWRTQIIRALGYSIRGTYGEYAFIHVGAGGNGKSTLLKLVQRALGDYANSVSWKVLHTTASDAHETILAELEGARLSVVQMGGRPVSSEQLRTIVAEPDFKARGMHQNSRTIEATHTLHVAQNDPPPLNSLDASTRRRLIVFDWDVEIDNPDDELPLRLSAELDYVMMRLLRGYAEWNASDVDRTTTERYFERNSIYRFIHEETVSELNASIIADELYSVYTKWCKDVGERPRTLTAFGRVLTSMHYEKKRGGPGNRMLRLGIRLKIDGD